MAPRRRLFQTPAAQNDILDIYESIAIVRLKAAEKLLVKIDAAIDRIRQFPETNAECPDLAPGLRALRISPYLVFYRFQVGEVLIVRVLHGARDIGEADFVMPHRR